MKDAHTNSPLLELAPAELVVPLKVTHAGRVYRVTHRLRPPAPADWFAYEAALQMAVEELPPEPQTDEPRYRLLIRSADAALELWDRLALAVEGYAHSPAPEIPSRGIGVEDPQREDSSLAGSPTSPAKTVQPTGFGPWEKPAAEAAGLNEAGSGEEDSRSEDSSPAVSSSGYGFNRAVPGVPQTGALAPEAVLKGASSGDESQPDSSPAVSLSGHGFNRAVPGVPQTRALAPEAVLKGASSGDESQPDSSPIGSLSGHGFNRAEKQAARSASPEGVRGNPSGRTFRVNPPRVPPLTNGSLEEESNWRALIPLAHKEAAVRALTLVAPAQPLSSPAPNDESAQDYFPLYAEQIPVVLEAARGGRAYPRLAHFFRPPTVADERRYRRLVAETLVVRGARHPRTLIPARLPALCRLYDALILSVEGYSIEGRPPASGAQVIQSMDPWHKRTAVQALFGDVTETPPAGELASSGELAE